MDLVREYFSSLGTHLRDELQIGHIGEEISKAIMPKTLLNVSIGNWTFHITDAVVATWVVMAAIFALGWFLGHKREHVPTSKRQLIAEMLVDTLLKLCRDAGMNQFQSEKVAPFVGTIAIFITMTNLSSMFHIAPPAKNPAFPIALALFTIVYVIFMSIRFVGAKGFWRSLTYPRAMMLPFRILDYFIKPLSLSLRLFGNIFGAFILMEFVYLILPAILPGLVGLWFDLGDGILQGIIFTYLTVNYIGEAIEGAHASAHEAAAGEVNAH